MKIAFVVLCAVLAAACEKGRAAEGKERGDCYGNGTCDPGLVCLSDLCVRPPPADCDKVADKLAGYRLGNYAPREEREKVVGELAAQCASAKLSKEEGDCILEAKGRLDLARCPRPLLDELKGDKDGCKQVGQRFAAMFADEFGKTGDRARVEAATVKLAEVITESCTGDGWPEELKKCVMMAQGPRDMDDCGDAMPKEMEDKIEQRLEPVIEQIMREMSGASDSAPTEAPATPPSASRPATGSGIPNCDLYVAAVEKYLACDKVPQPARDAAKQGLDAMKAGWSNMASMPEDARKAANDACGQAVDALKQGAQAMGCAI